MPSIIQRIGNIYKESLHFSHPCDFSIFGETQIFFLHIRFHMYDRGPHFHWTRANRIHNFQYAMLTSAFFKKDTQTESALQDQTVGNPT